MGGGEPGVEFVGVPAGAVAGEAEDGWGEHALADELAEGVVGAGEGAAEVVAEPVADGPGGWGAGHRYGKVACMRRVVQIPYKPRPQQKVVAQRIREGARMTVLVCHRRFGKTLLSVNLLLQAALQTPRPRPRCALVGPTYKQAKATAWDYLVYYSRPIPGIKVHNGELRVDYPNGGQVRLYGADNPDALRGIYLDAVVLDEYGLHPSETFTEVLAPTLVDRGGWAMFCGTPNGHNQFYQMAEQAKAKQAAGDPAWAYFEYKASETGLLDPGYLQQARLVMTEDEFQQEFECSFSASMRGSIYGKQLEAVEQAGRITHVPYQPELPVETTWDLGVGDATAIWFTQRLRNGEVHVIDYYEASGEGLPHFIHVLQTKGYVYGKHFGPHDLAARELGTGKSRLEVAARLGVKFELVPDIGLEDGIQAARLLLQRTWFDAQRCREGLAALRAYRRQWDTRLGEFKAAPVHNWASHAADAFRYLAVWMTPPHVQQRRRLLWSPAMEAAYGWMA